MQIVFYVIMVWLKIIICTTLIFLWLWVVRDRGAQGWKLSAHVLAALAFWVLPWAAFFWLEADLYQGHCGLRQGIRDCGLTEFLWSRVRWLRYEMALDILLFVGVAYFIFRARISNGTNSGALGVR
jgi:hypothetical protein